MSDQNHESIVPDEIMERASDQDREFLAMDRAKSAVRLVVDYASQRGQLGRAICGALVAWILSNVEGLRPETGLNLRDQNLVRFNSVADTFRQTLRGALCDHFDLPAYETSDAGRQKQVKPPHYSSVQSMVSNAKTILTSTEGNYTFGDILRAVGMDADGNDAEYEPGLLDKLAKQARGSTSSKSKSWKDKVREADLEDIVRILMDREDVTALIDGLREEWMRAEEAQEAEASEEVEAAAA